MKTQGQYNSHAMHYHVSGSYHAKFDDDDCNSFRGIVHRHMLKMCTLFCFVQIKGIDILTSRVF